VLDILSTPCVYFAVLFAEPTTGLDSATSMAIIGALIRLRKTGVNIVATLHQPRFEIYNQIQNLILLAPGGRLAYFGNPHLLRTQMMSLGYLCQPEDNPADFVMDLMAGFILKNNREVVTAAEVADELVKKWHDDHYHVYRKYLENEEEYIRRWNATNEDHESEVISGYHSKSSLEKHRRPSLRRWLFLFLYGADKTFVVSWLRQEKVSSEFNTNYGIFIFSIVDMQVNERSVQSVISSSYVLIFFGALVALLFGPIALTASSSSGVATQIVSSQLTFALLTLTAQLRLFSFDSLIRVREENGGLLLLPWYLGKVLAGYVDALFTPIAFVLGYFSFVQSRTNILDYWLLYVLLYLAISGLANFCSCMFAVRVPLSVELCLGDIFLCGTQGKSRVSFASGLLVVLWCFGGVSPSYTFIVARLNVLGILLNACSPFKWSLEMQVRFKLTGT
jgi:hypothetical protein